ncbi:MAG: 3-oxoacyl-[acyl-carrier-protein] synthase III C-terminal domain-containing protein [Burkholderiales bacterium]
MDPAAAVATLGVGYCVPDSIRTNDDPIFDWLNSHRAPNTDIFTGLKQRRVLVHAGDVVDIMVASARNALDDARKLSGDIDLLMGSASVGQYYAPSDLAAVHAALKLSDKCRIFALNTEYTNFHDGMKLSNDLIKVGTTTCALVVCGCNWTHHVNYHESVALAASDGAGAAVVGWTSDESKFRLVDWENVTRTEWFGALRMAQRPLSAAMNTPPETGLPDPGMFSLPLMKLDDERGSNAVKQFGLPEPGIIVNRLLERNKLQARDITLIAHQTSKFVYDAWVNAIRPGQYISTLEELGDMVSASVPVNLARCYSDIQMDKLVLLGIGMEMRATALLYSRGKE